MVNTVAEEEKVEQEEKQEQVEIIKQIQKSMKMKFVYLK